MKQRFAIFLVIVLFVYFGINYYIYVRGLRCVVANFQLFYQITFLLFFIAFPLTKFLERTKHYRITRPVSFIGSIWLGAMLYFSLLLIVFDLFRMINLVAGILPGAGSADWFTWNKIIGTISFLLVLGLIFTGSINAHLVKIVKLNLSIRKATMATSQLNIVAVSDIHMGLLLGKRQIRKLAGIIDKLHPDIILFVGDLIDEVAKPVKELDIGLPLRNLNAPLGKYAVSGNHEFIGGIASNLEYIESLGIKVLQDEFIIADNRFILAGRMDKDISAFTGKKRKPLREILAQADMNLPIILMDHQPFKLNYTVTNGVDLQLSGHTHHGQLWPLNYITSAIFELSHGYIKKGNTHFYVSSGFGTWGPMMRIGSRSEVLNIILEFESQKSLA